MLYNTATQTNFPLPLFEGKYTLTLLLTAWLVVLANPNKCLAYKSMLADPLREMGGIVRATGHTEIDSWSGCVHHCAAGPTRVDLSRGNIAKISSYKAPTLKDN